MYKNIAPAIFVIVFLLLLVNHLRDFNINYFKYSSSFLINKWRLQYGYFFMILVELASVLLILLRVKRKSILRVYDCLLAVYVAFLAVCLGCMYEITDGCIDCHYIAKVFFEDHLVTLGIVAGTGLLYLLVIRPGLYHPGAVNKFHDA
jgi:hypothetical protein